MDVPVEQLLLPRPRLARLDPRRRVAAAPGPPDTVVDRSLPAEGYHLEIGADGTVRIAAAGAAGHFYGRATVDQLTRVCDGALPVGTVEDWPDLALRGVMLDVSRCKVPSVDTLLSLVDRLASWKVNHVELYMEHTFAYPGHEEVWEGADPYDAADLARLDAHCRERHMALVPNQNCLGHMERWLLHDRYAPLGISRGVVSGPLGMPMPASTLDPANPDALALVQELLGALHGALPSPRLHIGLDEPWDLPAERAGEWRSWLDRIRALPDTEGRELFVWGDMVGLHPELARDLPDGVVVCEWGYEANHPFAARTEALAGIGARHLVCPGTSSWLSVLGRTTNAVDNCRAAADAARRSGAEGLLVTDWGDFGHLQYLPVSDPGLAAAAALSWCLDANRDLDAAAVAGLLDLHCYDDPGGALGAALVALGDAHLLQPMVVPNVSGLVLHLYFPQLPIGRGLGEDITPADVDAVEAALDGAVSALGSARPRTGHGALARDELVLAARLVHLLCRDMRGRITGDGSLSGLPAALRDSSAGELDGLADAHGARWLARNRPGGLEESSRWLTHLRDCYRTGEADAGWAGPLVERIRARTAGT